MADHQQLPPRPAPPRGIPALATAWLAWFGLGRLIAAACCTLGVVAGAYWLVRAPAPAPEASLPLASSSASGNAASAVQPTLPPPVGAEAGTEVGVVVVHVAGAVMVPGVYRLDAGARVIDAVGAAGGASATADLAGLNLAAPLIDGVRVYVPVAGEVDPASVPSGLPGADGGDGGDGAGPIDLNVATAEQLETLPGVGPATAAAIIDDRARNGPFASVDDLDRVPGIGPAKLAALRDLVSV